MAGPLRNDGELTFHTGVSASISERLRIDHNGNVGIGTASPASYANYNTLTIQGTNGGEIDWKIHREQPLEQFITTQQTWLLRLILPILLLVLT